MSVFTQSLVVVWLAALPAMGLGLLPDIVGTTSARAPASAAAEFPVPESAASEFAAPQSAAPEFGAPESAAPESAAPEYATAKCATAESSQADLGQGFGKLDPILRQALAGTLRGPLSEHLPSTTTSLLFPGPGQVKPASTGSYSERYIPCHVRFASEDWKLSSPGTLVRARSGDVGLISVKPEALRSLAESEDVIAIQLAALMSFKNDTATVETGVRQAREAFGATGAGVVIGFIGSGVDMYHEDFLDRDGRSRILYLLDFSEPGDTDGDGILDGPDHFGGTLYTRAQIDSALAGLRNITGWDRRGHETHVMGVAAGNGNGTGNGFPAGTFAGVATEADLIVVKSSLADLAFVGPGEASAGLAFIDSRASELETPYVVNMSFGTHLSAHDGTSLEERFIDNIVGRGKRGKAVIVSAGNEGSNYGAEPDLHCSGALSQGEKALCSITLPTYTPQPGEFNDGLILDMWYEGAEEMRVTVRPPGGGEFTASTGESGRWSGSYGSLFIENAIAPNPLNLDNECFIQIDDGGGTAPASGIWSVEVEAVTVTEAGRFDMWLAFSSGLGGELSFDSTSLLTNERLIATPGNAFNAITVGSYVNKESWLDLDNNFVFFEPLGDPPSGAIAPGSSPGPTRDGRMKPELAAPGRAVASALSRDAWPGTNDVSIFNGCAANVPRCLVAGDGRHAVARGTSFAAAHVTGIAALLLQVVPDLDSEELCNILGFTARSGPEIGGPWGHGKVDALSALGAADAALLVEVFDALKRPDHVRLSWRASASAEVEGFRLYRGQALKGPYDMIHSSAGPEGTYADFDIEPGSSLYYRLGALLPEGQERALPPITPHEPPAGPTLRLVSLYPNPARTITTLRLLSLVEGNAVASAFDAAGRLVDRRDFRIHQADVEVEYKWLWIDRDGERVPPGVYFLVLEAAGARAAAKVMVLP